MCELLLMVLAFYAGAISAILFLEVPKTIAKHEKAEVEKAEGEKCV